MKRRAVFPSGTRMSFRFRIDRTWAKFHALPFRLLSDHSHTVARVYGSFNETSLYNKRTVFVINKQGTIAYANLAYSVGDLRDFERLRKALAEAK